MLFKTDYLAGKHNFVARSIFCNFDQAEAGVSQTLLNGSEAQRSWWQDRMTVNTYVHGNSCNEFRFILQRNYFTSAHCIPDSFNPCADFITGQFPGIEVIVLSGSVKILGSNPNLFPRTTSTLSDHLNLVRGQHKFQLAKDGKPAGEVNGIFVNDFEAATELRGGGKKAAQ